MAIETKTKPNILEREQQSWERLSEQLDDPNNQQCLKEQGWIILNDYYDPEKVDSHFLSWFQIEPGILAARLGHVSPGYPWVLVYHRDRIEVVKQAIIEGKTDREEALKWFDDPDDKGNRRGYTLLPTSADRLVGYKNLQSTS